MIPEQFGRVAVLTAFALAFPALPLGVSFLFSFLHIRPDNPDPVKHATYECGVEAEGSAWGRFNARHALSLIIPSGTVCASERSVAERAGARLG